jgi:hypothetical protein
MYITADPKLETLEVFCSHLRTSPPLNESMARVHLDEPKVLLHLRQEETMVSLLLGVGH